MKTIPYGHQWIDEEDIKEVVEVLKSDWITQGPKIKEFEEALCSYTGAKYAVVVSSGTAALHIAALAGGIKPKDEAITSPITFVASANCVLYCGGRPVFADIQEDTANIDPEEIEKKITKRTKAIIPVHFAGHPCDLEEIRNIAKKYNLIVIEDACHALGAEYKGTKIGSCRYSDMTIFSFHPVKSITTGEGGAVLTNNKELYEKLLMLRNHGITKENLKCDNPWYYEMQDLGFNYRLTDLQCVLGINQLKKLDKFVEGRKKIAQRYDDAFNSFDGITILKEASFVKSSYHLYVILVNNRKIIFNKLREAGIIVNVHYIPVYFHPYYQQLGYKFDMCPNAESYYKKAISLPIFPNLSDENVDFVIEKVKEAIRGS